MRLILTQSGPNTANLNLTVLKLELWILQGGAKGSQGEANAPPLIETLMEQVQTDTGELARSQFHTPSVEV